MKASSVHFEISNDKILLLKTKFYGAMLQVRNVLIKKSLQYTYQQNKGRIKESKGHKASIHKV